MDRRQFLKAGALAGAGAAYFSGAHLYLSDERWTPNRSYWVSRGRAPVNPPLKGNHSVDLAVIGGGVTGLYDNGLCDTRERYLFAALERFMKKRQPELTDYPFEYTWTGPMGVTGDQEPVMGTEGKEGNIFYCGGYAGVGIAMGTRTGQWLAGMLEGTAPPDWLLRDTFRFPGEPLRYIGVNSVINLMNLSLLRMKKHE